MEKKTESRISGNAKRKLRLTVFVVAGAISVMILAWIIAPWLFTPNSTAIGIIGGADGPTAVFVSSGNAGGSNFVGAAIVAILGLLILMIGIRKIKGKK